MCAQEPRALLGPHPRPAQGRSGILLAAVSRKEGAPGSITLLGPHAVREPPVESLRLERKPGREPGIGAPPSVSVVWCSPQSTSGSLRYAGLSWNKT